MNGNPAFALNHMCAPALGVPEFFDLARSLGISAVEIRNDLPGRPILDGTDAAVIRGAAAERNLRIISINALQRFNQWSDERAREAGELLDYAVGCGAEALILVPLNDGTGRANGERQANLRIALKALMPMLQAAGVRGLVEPLGFEECSLRFKSEAAEAIRSIDTRSTFALVHDTFHHHLAGEQDIFADLTGLVHISGVRDASVAVSDMRDGDRVLVDEKDRLGNIEQISRLTAAGYAGLLSFEPFAQSVHSSRDIAADLRRSMQDITARLVAKAA
jgi:2-keto-myo-inositol isomerase